MRHSYYFFKRSAELYLSSDSFEFFFDFFNGKNRNKYLFSLTNIKLIECGHILLVSNWCLKKYGSAHQLSKTVPLVPPAPSTFYKSVSVNWLNENESGATIVWSAQYYDRKRRNFPTSRRLYQKQLPEFGKNSKRACLRAVLRTWAKFQNRYVWGQVLRLGQNSRIGMSEGNSFDFPKISK